MRGRDAVRKSTLEGERFTGLHDRFPRDPVYRESQCKVIDELATSKTYVSSLHRGIKKIPKTISHLEQSRQKWACETSMLILGAAVSIKKKSTPWVIHNKLKSLSIQHNTVFGFPLQAHCGGTSLNGIGK